jgi:predicted aminopeptidase
MPVRYLTQAAAGQDELQRNQIDIDEILRGPYGSHHRRELLSEVAVIKQFGEQHGLRATQNYTTFVELHRPQVIWVTTACEPLRFRPKTWTWPIIGNITYLGWFHRAEADAFVDDLRKKGWDVDVRASHAYSTLGWFKDPVLSTMLEDGPEARGELADVILHESLHATFYVPGQSTLNESVASFVGDALALEYLDARTGVDSLEKKTYLASEDEGVARAEAFREAYHALETLYAGPLPKDEKLREKARIIDALRAKTKLKRPITNATLIQYKTYGSGRAELAKMFEGCGKSWPRFLAGLEKIKPQLQKSREQQDPGKLLAPLIDGACQ